jgi:hypothetical protein
VRDSTNTSYESAKLTTRLLSTGLALTTHQIPSDSETHGTCADENADFELCLESRFSLSLSLLCRF